MCEDCGHAFTRKSDLDKHRILRLQRKPFPCNHCCHSFKLRKYLLNHLKIQHTDALKEGGSGQANSDQNEERPPHNESTGPISMPPPGTGYLVPVVYATLGDMENFTQFVKTKIEAKNLDRLGMVKVSYYWGMIERIELKSLSWLQSPCGWKKPAF